MATSTCRTTTNYEEQILHNLAEVLPYLSEFELARWIGQTEGMARVLEQNSCPSVQSTANQ